MLTYGVGVKIQPYNSPAVQADALMFHKLHQHILITQRTDTNVILFFYKNQIF